MIWRTGQLRLSSPASCSVFGIKPFLEFCSLAQPVLPKGRHRRTDVRSVTGMPRWERFRPANESPASLTTGSIHASAGQFEKQMPGHSLENTAFQQPSNSKTEQFISMKKYIVGVFECTFMGVGDTLYSKKVTFRDFHSPPNCSPGSRLCWTEDQVPVGHLGVKEPQRSYRNPRFHGKLS